MSSWAVLGTPVLGTGLMMLGQATGETSLELAGLGVSGVLVVILLKIYNDQKEQQKDLQNRLQETEDKRADLFEKVAVAQAESARAQRELAELAREMIRRGADL